MPLNLIELMEDKIDIKKIIEDKFCAPAKFTQEIENLVVKNKDMNYIDAILFFCDQNGIEIESVPKLLTKPLKEKLKCEAMSLNFMKKTTRSKLIF